MNRITELEQKNLACVADLEPREVFTEFAKICSIPHGSGNIGQISDYLVDWAKQHGLSYTQETCGNVIIRKPGTDGYENAPTVIIQGHMDMVTVKEPGAEIDMETSGLTLCREEDRLYAEATSLGGDDGICIAYGLAILASKTIPHPPLELLATVNEETGMDGASMLHKESLKGRRLLNIDSEDEGILLTGCAGGKTLEICFDLVRKLDNKSCLLEVQVDGLQGGHSGTEIDKNRANAGQLLARLLQEVGKREAFAVYSLAGGEKDNAIMKSAACLLGAQEDMTCEFQEAWMEIYEEIKAAEPQAYLRVTKKPELDIKGGAIDRETVAGILTFLRTCPYGVQSMSVELPGIVETSDNIGIICCTEGTLTIHISVRSMKESAKQELGEKIRLLSTLVHATCRTNGAYPGWQYREESPLRETMIRVYEELYHEKPRVEAIHAGLECGLLLEKMPDLDCVSFGPDILDIHTTKERLMISSTKRVWEYLCQVLGNLR